MLTLIRYFEHSELSPKDHKLGQILNKIWPASKLARLFAEELVHVVFKVSPPAMTWNELSALNSIGNVWSAIGEAQGRLIGNSAYYFGDRFEMAKNRPQWKEYMVRDNGNWPVGKSMKE